MMEITDRNFVGRHKREPSDYVKYRKKITKYARKKRREANKGKNQEDTIG